jgi:hypothetical protein
MSDSESDEENMCGLERGEMREENELNYLMAGLVGDGDFCTGHQNDLQIKSTVHS